MARKQRHTYRYNPHTLRYEKVFVSLKEKVRRISFNVLLGVVLGVVLVCKAIEALGELILTGGISATIADFTIGWPGLLLQIVGGYLIIKYLLNK